MYFYQPIAFKLALEKFLAGEKIFARIDDWIVCVSEINDENVLWQLNEMLELTRSEEPDTVFDFFAEPIKVKSGSLLSKLPIGTSKFFNEFLLDDSSEFCKIADMKTFNKIFGKALKKTKGGR